MSTNKCLLRTIDESACTPMNMLYLGLHGANGKGGRVGAAGIPADYTGVLLADSPAREGQPKVYDLLEKYVASFDKQFPDVEAELVRAGKSDDQLRIKSLYLWSASPGTGKTTTACALLNEWVLRSYIGWLKRGVTPAQRLGYFLDATELQKDYNSFNRPRVPDEIAEPAAKRYYEAIEKAKRSPFVVIDDIGVRDATDGFRGDLHSIVNERVTSQFPTVYTSNVPIEGLSKVFGEARLADRVRDLCQPIHFEGESKRGRRG